MTIKIAKRYSVAPALVKNGYHGQKCERSTYSSISCFIID